MLIVFGFFFCTFSPDCQDIYHIFPMASPTAPGIEAVDLIAGETVNSLVTGFCPQDPDDLEEAKNAPKANPKKMMRMRVRMNLRKFLVAKLRRRAPQHQIYMWNSGYA